MKITKTIMLAVLAVLLASMVFLSGCGESEEERQERIAREQARQAELERQREEAKRQREELNKLVEETVAGCNAIEDGYNKSFCFAEEAVRLKQEGKNAVNLVCDQSNSTDMCYFYAATMLKNPVYCKQVEDETGCKLVSTKEFCKISDLENTADCLRNQAYFISMVDYKEAEKICAKVRARYPRAIAGPDDLTCDDINWTARKNDNSSMRDRFTVMYFLLDLAGFHIVEEYRKY
jgi:hypothetical protein